MSTALYIKTWPFSKPPIGVVSRTYNPTKTDVQKWRAIVTPDTRQLYRLIMTTLPTNIINIVHDFLIGNNVHWRHQFNNVVDELKRHAHVWCKHVFDARFAFDFDDYGQFTDRQQQIRISYLKKLKSLSDYERICNTHLTPKDMLDVVINSEFYEIHVNH